MRPAPTLSSYWQVKSEIVCAKKELSTAATSTPAQLHVRHCWIQNLEFFSLENCGVRKVSGVMDFTWICFFFCPSAGNYLTSEKYRDGQEKIISYRHLHSDNCHHKGFANTYLAALHRMQSELSICYLWTLTWIVKRFRSQYSFFAISLS